jgi:branched-chain amino acid transport system permease protein
VVVFDTATGTTSSVGTLAVPTHDAGGAVGRRSAFLFGGGQATSVATVQSFPTARVRANVVATPAVAQVVGKLPMSWPEWQTIAAIASDVVLAATLVVVLVLSLVLGAIALRVGGIAFAMVTLAFAQAFYYLVEDNPHNLTGGDTGLALASSRLPGFLSGAVSNTRSLYWLALVYLVLVGVVVRVVLSSATGRVLVAVRENEQRVEVLGLRPFGFKLVAFTLSSLVAAGGGVVYILLIGTAVPSAVASTTLTLSILVMVVLGGPGSAWGPVAGAFVYVYLQQLLLKVAAEPSFASLPAVARVPLSQPQFLLGALFVLFVLFVPGGFAGAVARARARRTSRRPAAPVARGDS